jgi:hypothetical protein
VGNKHTWASALFVAAVVMAVTAFSDAATTNPRPWTAPWFLTCLFVAAGLLTGAMILLVGARQATPHLSFGQPYVAERGLVRAVPKTPPGYYTAPLAPSSPPVTAFLPPAWSSSAGAGASIPAASSGASLTWSAFFAYVRVYNEPRANRQSAERVWARISFFRSDGKPLLVMDGRWSDPPESQLESPTIRAPEVQSMPANGNPYDLDVAFKYAEDACCYAFNNENRINSTDLRQPDRALGDPHVVVRVEVSGNTGTLVGHFDLRHNGRGSQPTLQRHPTHRTFHHPLAGELVDTPAQGEQTREQVPPSSP